MAKSPDAFRTISEVSAWLETPPHVLRFWESKFPQVKPVKRAGGRRYYRPEDIALLGGIKVLLHEQGMTIRGVQKMLREQGVRHVASLSAQAWDGTLEDGGLDGEAIEDGLIEDGAAGPGFASDLASGLDADLGLSGALDRSPDGGDADEAPLDGVILGPWAGQGLAPDDEADADVADLAALDGVADGNPGEARPLPEPPAPTLIEAFLAGTLSRLNAVEARPGAPAAGAGEVPATTPGAAHGTTFEAAPEHASMPSPEMAAAVPAGGPASDPSAALAPAARAHLPPGELSLAHAMELLRRADPERLRGRADRIAPLVDRLKALREGLPRRSA